MQKKLEQKEIALRYLEVMDQKQVFLYLARALKDVHKGL